MKYLNNLKDPITDLVGLAIIILTLYEKYHGTITWVWEGIAGLIVGVALFMMPDDWLRDSIDSVKKKFTDKKDPE